MALIGVRRSLYYSAPVAAGGGGALTFTATDTAVAWQNSQSAATFTNAAIGTASSDRLVVVAIAIDGNANGVVSGVTIGGNAATKAVGVDPTGGAQGGIYIFHRLVTTGTTASIVVTTVFSNSIGIGVGIITGSASVAVSATNSAAFATTTDPHSLTTTVPANGVGVAAAVIDRAATASWTNATGIVDTQSTGGNQFNLFMAHGTNNSPSFTGANNFTVGMAMATYAP